MPTNREEFSEYPEKIRGSMQQPSLVYTRLPNYYAVHQLPEDLPTESSAMIRQDEGTLGVFEGDVDQRTDPELSGDLRPVYGLQTGGALAVPTGQVFIRFKEGMSVKDQLDEIARLGYELSQNVSYAPHAAWLRARSHKIADALTRLESLKEIAGVENVEPQMLMQKALK